MNLPGCLIIESDTDWKIVAGELHGSFDKQITPVKLAAAALELLNKAGLKNANAILAPASSSCFFCRIPADDALDLRDDSALLYALEEHLPIDAESSVAASLLVESEFAVVAIETSPWKEIADALEAVDIQVHAIVPATALAARAFCELTDTQSDDELIFHEQGNLDAVRVDGKRNEIVRWKHLALNEKAIHRHRVISNTAPLRTILIEVPQQAQRLFASSDAHVQIANQDLQTLVVHGASIALEDQSKIAYDLRRGWLAAGDPLRAISRQLGWLLAAVAIFVLAVTLAGWWRKHRIETEIASIRQQQTSTFKEAFPESRSRAILRHVRSEHAKVLGSWGQDKDVRIPTSAPSVLRRLIMALPNDVRYQVSRIQVRDGEVELTIRARDTISVGKIASSLSEVGFEVSPPGTVQLSPGTIESTLTAKFDAANNEDSA